MSKSSSSRAFKPVGSFQYIDDVIVHFDKKIGEEVNTEIFEGFSRTKSEKIAIKCIDLTKNPGFLKTVEKEIKILKSNLNNPNICKLIDYSITKTSAYLITEIVKGLDLSQYLQKQKSIGEDEAVRYLNHIVCGMKALVSLDLLHGNLNPSNLILHENMDGLTIKFPNFLYSAHLEELNASKLQIPKKTYAYMAPEVLQNLSYHKNSEIWSLGIIFYEMIYGIKPWDGQNTEEHLKIIMTQELKFPDEVKISDTSIHFLRDCLNRDPNLRPEWKDLINHRLIFRSLFMQNDKTYSLYNPKFNEHSPTKANLKYGLRKEGTVTSQAYLNLSSTLSLIDSPKKSRKSETILRSESKSSEVSILLKSQSSQNSSSLNITPSISKLSTCDKKTETSRHITHSKSSVILNSSKVIPKTNMNEIIAKKYKEKSFVPTVFYSPIVKRQSSLYNSPLLKAFDKTPRANNSKDKNESLKVYLEINNIKNSKLKAEFQNLYNYLKENQEKSSSHNDDKIMTKHGENKPNYIKLLDMIREEYHEKDKSEMLKEISLLLNMRDEIINIKGKSVYSKFEFINTEFSEESIQRIRDFLIANHDRDFN